MKKTIISSILGLTVAATVTTSQAQGFIRFSSYIANGNVGATTDVAGTLVGNTYFAGLYYAFGNNVSDSNAGDPTGIPGSSFTLSLDPLAKQQYAVGSATAGYFDGGIVSIPGYVSGPVSFEVTAWTGGTSYGDPLNTFRGRTGVFTVGSLATGASPAGNFGDGVGSTPMANFTVISVVPEPSTLALVGLGTGALLFFRRDRKSVV